MKTRRALALLTRLAGAFREAPALGRTGAFVMAALLAGLTANAAEHAELIPPDKDLASDWKLSLYARGIPERVTGDALDNIGMPCGGIGAGQLLLRGDGTLTTWEIFNHHNFRGVGTVNFLEQDIRTPVEQGFAVVCSRPGVEQTVPLNREGFDRVEFRGEYPIGTVRYSDPETPVDVTMEVFSPFIPLNAPDSALPLTYFHVTLKNTSPVEVEASVLGWLENAVNHWSGKYFAGTVRNTEIIAEDGLTMALHSAELRQLDADETALREPIPLSDFERGSYSGWKAQGEAFGEAPATGALGNQQEVTGFQGEGLVNSYRGGDASTGTLTSPRFTINRRFINFLVGGGAGSNTAVRLVVDGEPVRSASGANSEALQPASWSVGDLQGKVARIRIVDNATGGWGHINADHFVLSDESANAPGGSFDEQRDSGTMALAVAGPAGSALPAERLPQGAPIRFAAAEDVAFGTPVVTGLRSAPVKLAPGESSTATFVIAWYFPNKPHGRIYENWFSNAADAARYAIHNHGRLAGDTRQWRDAYYDSTLPFWLLDRLHIPLACLATGTAQWWENGRFYAYEGVVCCGGTCTHVWNYAHGHARLFPMIARSIREMQDFHPAEHGGGFHPDTGLVGFRSNDAYAADGQCGTVLKAYREHLMSKDNRFLKRNWPRIKKALQYSIEQDGNADGLIENSQHNTYDINFFGANTMIGSLYLAALRAGEEMADIVGDEEFAKQVRSIYRKGRRATVASLWNGEYFIQDVDLEEHPQWQYGDGCLSDHLFGQGWAMQLGLGDLYPKANVRSALQSIWKYNWAPEVGPYNEAHPPWRWFVEPSDAGLFTCTWPLSDYLPQGVNYKDEVWTGIEYQVAGNMAWEGMLDEALSIVRGIHLRYDAAERNPFNEVECGDYYARALASWGVLIGLQGYSYDGPDKRLGFAPRMTPHLHKSAFTTAEGWGSFAQRRIGAGDDAQRNRIDLKWGRLELQQLDLDVPDDVQDPAQLTASVQSSASGWPTDISVTADKDGMRIRFAAPITLRRGDWLYVTMK